MDSEHRKSAFENLSKKFEAVLLMAAPAAAALGSLAVPETQPLLALAATVGVNVLSNQTFEAFKKFDATLRTSQDGLVNHDLQRALALAFQKALENMERLYLHSERLTLTPRSFEALEQAGLPEPALAVLREIENAPFVGEAALQQSLKQRGVQTDLRRYWPRILEQAERRTPQQALKTEQIDAIRHFFKTLQEAPQENFFDLSEADLNTLLYEADEDQAVRLLYQRVNLERMVKLDREVYGQEFWRFFQRTLTGQAQLWFYEILKQDEPESTKAWRAYQRLMLEFLQANQHELYDAQQAGFEKIQAQLTDIKAALERLPATQRLKDKDEPFAEGLNAAVEQLRGALQIIGADVREIKVDVKLIGQTVQETHDDVKKLTQHFAVERPESTARTIELFEEYTSLFVGREDAFAYLNSFWQQRQSGICLVTAPAGYGKTALLANWSQSLANLPAQEQPVVIRHAFSQRTDVLSSVTEAYRSLLYQLYQYYQSDGSLRAQEYELRSKIYNLLAERGVRDDRPLVFVLDGLDEAGKPFEPPFPPILPKGMFVIASARAAQGDDPPKYLENWTERAERLELDGLSRAAIQEWLHKIEDGALTELAADDTIVTRLWEITQGFSLYLSYLIQELSEAHRQGQNLHALLEQTPKGFKAYIEQQVAHLDELDISDAYWRFFALLAVSKGYLCQADLKTLTTMRDRDFRKFRQTWQITRWLSIRQQEQTVWYDFAHPLLGTSFARILGDDAKDALDTLLNWCARLAAAPQPLRPALLS